MRVRPLLFLLLLAAPEGLAAQSGESAWALSLALDGVRFAGTARDTAVAAPAAASLRPSGRLGARIGLRRVVAGWRVELAAGVAPGNVEAANDAVAIRDRTADLSRYRLAVGVERVLGRVGAGELALGLAPTLDLWTLEGDARPRMGAECGLALRVPVGGAALEHRLGLGLSGSPLERSDVGRDFSVRGLRTVTFGVGLQVPL